jgi:putative SOS response-associated peptidase YedK
MCFSAQVWTDYRKYQREFGADLDIKEFLRLYEARAEGAKLKIPKGIDASFGGAKSGGEREIRRLIEAWNTSQATALEQELFKQTKRVNDAGRALQAKETKKAQEDLRIGTDKVEKAKLRLTDLRRTEPRSRDSRIFPGIYAPVLVMESGKPTVMPMRYQCRPQGKPAKNDVLYPGTYNARRDSLEKYWKGLFGYSHGLMVASTFYENVEGKDGGNEVLQFTPRTGEDMLIACLWSRWTDPKGVEPDLLSFAAITDEPEPEVAAAGHDRTIINLRPENVDAWLSPDPGNLDAIYALFDDKQHPYYEHRLAA